jgi:EAL domain-containing protein (putative c-di-GMP-specific phosphodiesterase class I)
MERALIAHGEIEQGIRLALDDFGTGFSSLSHLRSLPFDIIKIDRTFVSNINSKRESVAIVRAVTTLASALSVPVCIEGIENKSAFDAVIRLGCQIGQGWYFGKPMPAEQARDMLARRAEARTGHREEPSSRSAARPRRALK